MIFELRNACKQKEKQLQEKITSEEKLRKEGENLRREINSFKEKLQWELTIRKAQEMNSKRVATIQNINNNINNVNITSVSVNKIKVNNIEDLNSSGSMAPEPRSRSKDMSNLAKRSTPKFEVTKKVEFNCMNLKDDVNIDINNSGLNQGIQSGSVTSFPASITSNLADHTDDLDNLTLNKIIKKRNYSDNNPNPNNSSNLFSKKAAKCDEVNIDLNSKLLGNNQDIKRDVGKSALLHKNILLDLKSPTKQDNRKKFTISDTKVTSVIIDS